MASLERSSSSRGSTWHWPAYCWLPVCLAVALSPVSPFRRRRRLFAALLLSKFMIIALPSILRAADSIRLSPNGGGTRCCWCRSSACAAAAADSGGGGREKPSDSAVIKIGFCAQLNHIFAFNWRLDSRVLTWLRSATAILLPSTLCDFFFSRSLPSLSLCSALLSSLCMCCLAKIYDYIEIWWFIRDRGQKTTLYVQEPSTRVRESERERAGETLRLRESVKIYGKKLIYDCSENQIT